MPGPLSRSLALFPLVALVALVAVPPLSGEILRLEESGPLTVVTRDFLPTRGENQQQVLARFGEPLRRFGTVGGGLPQQPPITRWDYADFSVIFEGASVLHSVVHGPLAPPFP